MNFPFLPSVALACAMLAVPTAPAAAQPPVRSFDPSVLELPLDGTGRTLVLTLHPSFWLAVDPASGGLVRAWNGRIDPHGGGDRSVRAGTGLVPVGTSYFASAAGAAPFRVERGGMPADARGEVARFEVGDGAVVLVHAIDDGRGERIELHETLRIGPADGTALLFERTFRLPGEPPKGVDAILVPDAFGGDAARLSSGAVTVSRRVEPPAAPAGPSATLTDAERAAGWKVLFDGTSLERFKNFGKDRHPDDAPQGWSVEDGCIARSGPGGDLATDAEFADFELHYEWKVGPGGNSGVMFRSTEDRRYPWETGAEMQVLDDARHGDGASPLTSAGANYALHAAPRNVAKPAGEWNVAYVRAVGNDVEYWLNGVKTAQYTIGSPEWNRLVRESKFGSMPDYGQRPSGKIVFQDHGDPVWFRNVIVREVDGG